MKKKKIILLSFISIATLFVSNKVIYAAGCLWSYNAQEAIEAEIATMEGTNCPEREVTTCAVWNSSNEESRTVNTNLYNVNKIEGYDSAAFKNAVLAGTFIGVDAYETYKKKINVDIDAKCVRYYTKCEHRSVPCEICGGSETIFVCECGTTSCEPDMNKCYKEASDLLEKLANQVSTSPAFVGVRQDVNDIKNKKEVIVKEDSENIDRGYPSCSGKRCTRTVTIEYTYNLGPAWIDPITGKVKYEGDTDDPVTAEDKKTYIKVPYDIGGRGWIYFIPLNAKSTDSFDYVLRSRTNTGNSVYGSGLCEDMINKYNDKNNDEYWGDMLQDLNGNKLSLVAKTQAEAKKKVSNGCLISYTGRIKIIQKFYYENNKQLKGYNFYYRPIDYSEPFPNGITDDSYWKNVYNPKTNAVTIANAAGNKQDLDNSFSKITYATNENYNLNKIREYNADAKNMYTNWQEMKINGTSSFISDNYGITRYNCQTYYALGCGPANEDWQECKSRKTEVCKK